MRLALCADASPENLVCARVLELPAEPPEWVELLPVGDVVPRDGRAPWRLDKPAEVLAATRERAGATTLVVDYEHQTFLAPANGQEAPAAGWIEDYRVNEDGTAIEGRIAWTTRAAERIKAREYRYLSPVFGYRPDRTVTALRAAALTNNPALELTALARDQSNNGSDSMNEQQLKALREALGLAADAEVPAILAAVASAVAGNTALAKVAEKVGLAKDASGDDVVAAAPQAPAAGEFVPRSEFDALAARATALETSTADEKATAAVDAAVEAGKVTPAQRDWALAYAKSDPEGFGSYVEATPAIVRPGRSGPGRPGTGVDPEAALTDEELAVCRSMGVSADDYKAARKAAREGTPPERKKPESE